MFDCLSCDSRSTAHNDELQQEIQDLRTELKESDEKRAAHEDKLQQEMEQLRAELSDVQNAAETATTAWTGATLILSDLHLFLSFDCTNNIPRFRFNPLSVCLYFSLWLVSVFLTKKMHPIVFLFSLCVSRNIELTPFPSL